MHIKEKFIILNIFIFVFIVSKIYGCTGIRLKSKDGSITYARTLEFGTDILSEILYIPRKHEYIGTTDFIYKDKPVPGLTWKSKYAVVGANALNLNYFVDGINEKGLAGGIFYLPDYAQYQDVTLSQANRSLGSWELLTFLLTTCSNIQEVKEILPKIKVSKVQLRQWAKDLPVHYIVHDTSGKSLVIEYIAGKLNLHDNALGVLTNAPSFDWHVTNLRNYVNIDALTVPKIDLSGITISPLGQGAGMLGLPGDFTPPSRFIRAIFFSQNIDQPLNSTEGITSAFHILNLFNIPKGIVRMKDAKFDYTRWTSACDLKNKDYYFHTYNNPQIYKISLNKLIQNKSKLTHIPMQRKQLTYSPIAKARGF